MELTNTTHNSGSLSGSSLCYYEKAPGATTGDTGSGGGNSRKPSESNSSYSNSARELSASTLSTSSSMNDVGDEDGDTSPAVKYRKTTSLGGKDGLLGEAPPTSNPEISYHESYSRGMIKRESPLEL